MPAMRVAYWARTQSSLKRLATNSVSFDWSVANWAFSGLIQVLNCCSGNSWARTSRQAGHNAAPAETGVCMGKRGALVCG